MEIFAKNQLFDFGETYYPNGGRYGPIFRSHLDLFMLLRGEATVIVDGITKRVSAGNVVCVFNEQSLESIFTHGMESHVFWCETGEFIIPKSTSPALKSLPFYIEPSIRLKNLTVPYYWIQNW